MSDSANTPSINTQNTTAANTDVETPKPTADAPKAPEEPRFEVFRNDIRALWCARLLLAANQENRLIAEHARRVILEMLGLRPSTDKIGWTREQWRTLVENRAAYLESQVLNYEGLVWKNACILADVLSLDHTDAELISLAVLIESVDAFEWSCDSVNNWSVLRASRVISRTLGICDRVVRSRLHRDAGLGSTGLVRLVKPSDYADSPFVVESNLVDVLRNMDMTPAAMMANFFELATPSSLRIESYEHVDGIDVLEAILLSALRTRRAGANVLLWGPPGTGKTELARLMADRLGADLYEVAVHDSEGSVLSSSQRLAAFQTCQRVLAPQKRSMVLFDEVEDVFEPRVAGASQPMKGSMNRILERNAAPAIWITNNVGRMDPAYLRRFDLALEVPVPSRPVRRRLVDSLFETVDTSEEWRDRVARAPELVPADLARAATVVSSLGDDSGVTGQETLQTVLSGTLKVRTGRRLDRSGYTLARDFDPQWLNTNVPVDKLEDGLGSGGRGSVLLYGPPGTGKTAWTYHLAETLGLDLEHKKMSDLLSCWVGETEQQIARAFENARRGGSLLFFDEADGLLRDRRGARNSWEVTQVNEFLVQLEAFDGIVVCSTNLNRDLDRAAYRRFAAKVRFDPLTADQRLGLVCQVLCDAGVLSSADTLDSRLQARIQNLTRLTPGDIAAARKRFGLLGGIPSAEGLVDALEEELTSAGIPGVDSAIGF